ncbi:SH3 domain-containing protein [Streptomyces sp. 12297]|uniref:SH3 domain-containing protein n=1 Tax=Streptomyces sp. NBC_00239 TaxID=2903640 RepID=UPI002E294DC2|nr:SH3 domain-containing protein [Streptomyces sp. NBC_00239]
MSLAQHVRRSSAPRLPLIAAAVAAVTAVLLSAPLASAAPAAIPATVAAAPAVVTGVTGNCAYQVSWNIDALNVRSGPGTNHSVIGTLAPGSYVSSPYCSDWVAGPGGNGWWVQISFKGRLAYVSTQFLNGLP